MVITATTRIRKSLFQVTVITMANSRVLLADLKAGRCSNVAEVRLLRFWEARNVRKGGEPMSVDMLFVDENSTLMQGSVGANRQLRFRDRLSEGSLYTLTGFDVTRSNTNFRLSDAPFSIRFNEGTELDKIPASVRPIPTELFRFMPCSQILELANTGKQLPVVKTFVLPGHGADPGSSTSKVVHAQKVEPMTISELNKFITTADSQIIEFLCTAEVTGIQLDDGWCYIGCSGCSKKLIREISSFTCVSWNETNAVAALRLVRFGLYPCLPLSLLCVSNM
ncbi:unnamed protein product [Brassica oleracea]